MKALWLLIVPLPLGGCPTDGNPKMLWLAPNMAETAVKLIDHEPDKPY